MTNQCKVRLRWGSINLLSSCWTSVRFYLDRRHWLARVWCCSLGWSGRRWTGCPASSWSCSRYRRPTMSWVPSSPCLPDLLLSYCSHIPATKKKNSVIYFSSSCYTCCNETLIFTEEERKKKRLRQKQTQFWLQYYSNLFMMQLSEQSLNILPPSTCSYPNNRTFRYIFSHKPSFVHN